MAEEKTIRGYGVFFTPEETAERATWHETTCLEYDIPQAIEKKLSKLIEKEVAEFENRCQCGLCKLHQK
jgi:hypothetical protein